MFGALQFGQGYFAQGPPGMAVLNPAVTADLVCLHDEALTFAMAADEGFSSAAVADEGLSFSRVDDEGMRMC